MWTSTFWASAGERAIKTFCQTLLGLLSAGSTAGLLDVNWGSSLKAAAVITVLSVLTSLASISFGASGSPSLVEHGKHEGV